MTISIIVPVYIGEKYIPNIIASYEKNIEKLDISILVELIIVNDYPGTDIALTVDAELSKYENDRFKVVCINNNVNSGIHASRINGVKAAVGEYVLFLDQDDKIADNYLESQIARIGMADVVVSNGIAELKTGNKMLFKYEIMQETVKSLWFNAVFGCRIISPGQCMIRKSSIPVQWLQNPLRENGADDYLLWLMMLSQKKKIVINRDLLYVHCYTGNNTSLDITRMNHSVAEILKIAKDTGIVKSRYLKMIEKRFHHLKGEKRTLFYSMEEIIRHIGERINKV